MQKVPRCSFCGITSQTPPTVATTSGGDDLPLMKCSGCLLVYYCQKEHQRLDWKRHKPFCKSQQEKYQAQHQHKQHRGDSSVTGSDDAGAGSTDSQLGASLTTSDCSIFSGNRELPAPITLQLPTALSADIDKMGCYSTSSHQSTAHGDEAFNEDQWTKRRNTYGSVDRMEMPRSLSIRKMSMDPQNPPKRVRFRNQQQQHVSFTQGITEKLDHSKNRPYDANAAASCNDFVTRIKNIADHAVRALKHYGWGTVDNFLGPTHASAVFSDVCRVISGGVGESEHGIFAANRENEYWFDNRTDDGVNVGFLISAVDSVIYNLCDSIPPYKIQGRTKAMISCHPGNGAYTLTRVDNTTQAGRCLTVLYYLNQMWQIQHGGILRLFPHTSLCPIDIEPLFDRLLFFWSDHRNPYQYLPSYAIRYSITLWYFDAEERTAAVGREVTAAATRGDFLTFRGGSDVGSGSPATFGSMDSLSTAGLSPMGSLPSLQDAVARLGSRANSLSWRRIAAASSPDNEYSTRRATFDLGHLS